MRSKVKCFSAKLFPTLLSVISVLFGLTGVTGIAGATETSFWTSEKPSDFLSGTPECMSIRQPEIVSLAPRLDTLLSSGESYFWSLARDGKGNIYAGSGDNGNVYKFGVRGDTSLVLHTTELEILSLAVDRNGSVYAGTSPGGLVYKITPDGKSSVFFSSGESYVWCLVFDESGNLYAGTGEHGKVYRIRHDGSGELFYDTGERHVMCAKYTGGKLVLGTEGAGLVMSVSPQGKGQVLYDCDEKEVRDLVVSEDGVVFAAAVSQSRKGAEPQTEPGSEEGDAGAAEKKALSSSIYKINKDGTATKLWTSALMSVYSLYLLGEDSLVIGTGDEGIIYGMADGKLELLQKVGDSQVLDMIGSGSALVLSTGNRARVYSLGALFCKEGTLVSNVFDATEISRWGSLTWESDVPRNTLLSFSVRAGNSEKPDKTWSEWSEELTSSGAVPVAFPGRFVQWRATLHSSNGRVSPSFRKVTLAYVGKNLAPIVTLVQVVPQGLPLSAGGMDKVPDRVSQLLPGGVKVEYSILSEEEERDVEETSWARSYRSAVWQASDPDDDRLSFSIFYRPSDERNWMLIAKDFRASVFTWRTASYPDGTYLLKVVASDVLDNTPSEALTGEGVSLPFDVDNTPPVIADLELTREKAGVLIKGRASDNMSPVIRLDYSLDGEDWCNLQASDGLLDSQREEFSFRLEGLAPGEHTMVIRARDGAQNIGTARLRIT